MKMIDRNTINHKSSISKLPHSLFHPSWHPSAVFRKVCSVFIVGVLKVYKNVQIAEQQCHHHYDDDYYEVPISRHCKKQSLNRATIEEVNLKRILITNVMKRHRLMATAVKRKCNKLRNKRSIDRIRRSTAWIYVLEFRPCGLTENTKAIRPHF
ncbi:unnamed protein product [Albugo candida]|uniref:Uncharacterized protein n=1 Tax=Albugo candida TaxID=65357 RepID=A0A024G6P6_9STRA|nr:unnamed protein product [Albugo candida]|eukprot:CCI42338.1 unnamed protein product [Albugo candida]